MVVEKVWTVIGLQNAVYVAVMAAFAYGASLHTALDLPRTSCVCARGSCLRRHGPLKCSVFPTGTNSYPLFLAGTSFVHGARTLTTCYYRSNVDFGVFKRDVILFKAMAIAQLAYLYSAPAGLPALDTDSASESLGLVAAGAGTPQHGLPSSKMALITSDCGAMRSPGIKNSPCHLGLCVPLQASPSPSRRPSCSARTKSSPQSRSDSPTTPPSPACSGTSC